MFGCACWPNLHHYNSKKLEFRSKQCGFLGYSNSHKGYICLEPSTGRVYISRDVVFDESIFPFASMHPNTGARLQAELRILPDVLLNPSTHLGGINVHDQNLSSLMTTNATHSLVNDTTNAEKNLEENTLESGGNCALGTLYFMCPPLEAALDLREIYLPTIEHRLRDRCRIRTKLRVLPRQCHWN